MHPLIMPQGDLAMRDGTFCGAPSMVSGTHDRICTPIVENAPLALRSGTSRERMPPTAVQIPVAPFRPPQSWKLIH
jgi:hypothetical protein